MSPSARPGKWIEGLHGDTPAVVAARQVLELRLAAVEQLLRLAARHADEDVEHVHRLRVATRRATAAVRHFAPFCDPRHARRMRKWLRSVRAAAATARTLDVHATVFAENAAAAEGAARKAFTALLHYVRECRADAQHAIVELDHPRRLRKLSRRRRRLLRPLRVPEPRPPAVTFDAIAARTRPAYTLSELAGHTLPAAVQAVRAHTPNGLRDPEVLHALRLAGKRLRYGLEIFAGCFPPEFRDEQYPRIEQMQERLGAVNDVHEIVLRIDEFAEQADEETHAALQGVSPAFARLRSRFVGERDRLQSEFLRWWASDDCAAVFESVAALIRTWCVTHRIHRPPPAPPPPADRNREAAAATAGAAAARHHRVAAIDVGTNSLRLVVAESDPTVRFRVIEDVKQATRLGAGLYLTGRLADEAMARTLAALQHMRRVAEGYHVERIRAVGTSAVREAANGDAFVEQAELRAGIRVEVIDAEHEARLAFCSVANTFDLDDRRCGIVDLGGGSTELVISAGGVIDAVHKLPLGAVRLTETHGRKGNRGKYRFGEMRRGVDQIIRSTVGAPPYPLELLIGTGGTFTSLARVSILRGSAPGAAGRFPFAVRGYELPHAEVREILGWLRRMPLEERRRVPGLSSQRAEIFVAGICIIERLMRFLGVATLRVHDGGIRDGLLSEMIDELGAAPTRPPYFTRSALAAVRAFARRSRYEKDHSEHVTRLAVRIFDQLAAALPDASGAWATREARDLLQAAGVLHDVGMLVAWEDHNRHSYDMIVHADLPLYSRRELEIIANVARYHRGGGPKASHANLRRLGNDDQRLVAHLAGILRIADGLDRLHVQNVTDVIVTAEPDAVRFEVRAAEAPRTNLRYARRKADVFESAFHAQVLLAWVPADAPAPLREEVQP